LKELLPAIIGFLIVGNIAAGYLANFTGIGKVIALGGLIKFWLAFSSYCSVI